MKPFRKDRIARLVTKIVGETIAHHINDPRVDPLTTVTRVEVTGDLLMARVFLSVPGKEAAERRTLAGIRSAAGFIQRTLARELTIRQCPELRFEIDEQVKRVRRTMELLAENRRHDPTLATETEPDEPSDEHDGQE
jgi:ribosome-binding factor A